MGIDYVLDLDCAPKQNLTTGSIIELHKARNRGRWLLERARENGDTRPPSEIPYVFELRRLGTLKRTDSTIQKMLDLAAPLDEQREACASCPANRGNPRGYGCYKFINYPIEADAEELLLSRLPDDLESPDGGMQFARALREHSWDGKKAAEMRASEPFFRQRTPPSRSWPTLTVDADRLFHMMFQVGDLEPDHSFMVGVFFGLLSIDEKPIDRTPALQPRSDSARQMFDFVKTLVFAAQNKLVVWIDA